MRRIIAWTFAGCLLATGGQAQSQKRVTFVLSPNGWVENCTIRSDAEGNLSLKDCGYSPDTRIIVDESSK